MTKNKKPIVTEHAEQKTFFEWANLVKKAYPGLDLMFAIPNGGARHIAVARKLKSEGVKPGVPDIFLPVQKGGSAGLFIEMKRVKNSNVTKAQRLWHKRLKEQGYAVKVCYGFKQAKEAVEGYYKETSKKGVFNHDEV